MMERHQRQWKKCLNPDSNRDPPAYVTDCSAVELLRIRVRVWVEAFLPFSLMTLHQFFQYSILPHFNQFISSLAALVCGSGCGGPVGEAKKPEVASAWGPEAEARWLRCPLAGESGRDLNSLTAEQSAA